MIPADAFEESADLAVGAMPEHDNPVSAEDMIDALMQYGSISDDASADIHPAHIAVDPGAPTVYGLAQQAKQLVGQYEAEGKEVPPELEVFAEAIQNIQSEDAGAGGDKNA